LHNHYFLPSGPTDADPIFSVWETREPMSVDEFQAFIDGPSSPVAGACTNLAHRVMPGGLVPSAFFRSRAFVSSMAMPLMDDTMHRLMERMLPFPLTLKEETAVEVAAAAEEHLFAAEMNAAAAKSLGAIRLQHQIDHAIDDIVWPSDGVPTQVAYGSWSRAKSAPTAGEGGTTQDEELARKLEQTMPLDVAPPVKLAAKAMTADKSEKGDEIGI
jgi:hypothetical protein